MDSRDGLYPKKVIANLLNLTERRIEQLTHQKIIPKAERGKYDLVAAVKAYVMYLQQRLSGGETIDITGLKDRLLKAETEEREAKAAKAQIELETLKGELISKEDVVREWISRLVEFKAALLVLPNEIGFLFAESQYRQIVEEGVEAFVYETLERYSREGIYTPAPVDDGGESGAPATKKDIGKSVGRRKKNPRQKKQLNAGALEDKQNSVSS